MSKTQQRTSVMVDIETFEEFKLKTILTKFNLQKLVDRGMFLYLNNEEFREKIHNTNHLEFKKKF